MVELHDFADGSPVTLWADHPVLVTVVHAGDLPLNEYMVRISRWVNSPNGRSSGLALFRGLPVIRYVAAKETNGDRAFMVRTVGGAVLRMKAAQGWGELPEDLDERATIAGVYFTARCPDVAEAPTMPPTEADLECSELAHYIRIRLGVIVGVRRNEAGDFVIAGGLSEETAKKMVAEWARARRYEETPNVDWNLSAYLGKKFGTYVQVAFYKDGHYDLETAYEDRTTVHDHIQQYLRSRKDGEQ